MVEIRPAEASDAKSICEINKSAFGYDYPEDKTGERLTFILGKSTDKIWVACVDDRVVGYIHGADYECTYSDSLKNIMAVAVDEKYRGLGIGKQLLMAVEKWAREAGCEGIRLVSGFNREKAHEFYLHCGYVNRKDQKNFVKLFSK